MADIETGAGMAYATQPEHKAADRDYYEWRAAVERELKKRPGRPALADFYDEAIKYSYVERCDTPAKAAAWLNA